MKLENRTNEELEVSWIKLPDASREKHNIKPNQEVDAGDRVVKIEIHSIVKPQQPQQPQVKK